jgi:hypothetical protein
MSPTLYGIFTSDPPELNDCEMAVFADDTAIFCSSVAVIVQSLQMPYRTISFHRRLKSTPPKGLRPAAL